MSNKITEGRRIHADENGVLSFAEGDYGYSEKSGAWMGRPPGCHAGSFANHEVIEHEDGTITVSPSILLIDDEHGEEWHGYLEHGKWREV